VAVALSFDGWEWLIIFGWIRYAIGTPDCISHLAEEIPRPASNLPKAIAAQMAVGFITFVNLPKFYAG
jgi:hypothetical protein